jgi:hypothetical protein
MADTLLHRHGHAGSAFGGQGAQTVTGEDTEVFNGIGVHASNGHVHLGAGTGVVGRQLRGPVSARRT